MSRLESAGYSFGFPGPERISVPPAERAVPSPYSDLGLVIRQPGPERLLPASAEMPQEAPEKVSPAPEKVKARPIELTAAYLGKRGVTIEKVKLGPDVRQVVITRADGVQVGWLSRQVNDFAFEMSDVRVSIDDLLNGHAGLERAFANLVADPDSKRANYVFRKNLPTEGSPVSGGRLRVDMPSGPAVRVSRHPDGRGAIVLDHVRGAQIGILSTQHNEFRCRLESTEFHLESVLRDSPPLARDLALAAAAPDNHALERSFARHLKGECNSSSWNLDEARTWYRNAPRVTSAGALGAQAGGLMSREDVGHLRVMAVTVVGWSARPDAEADDPAREQRLQQGHLNRISTWRSSVSDAEQVGGARKAVARYSASPQSGLAVAKVNPMPENFLPRIIERAAAATLNRIAPGRSYLGSAMARQFEIGLDRAEKVNGDHIELKSSIPDKGMGHHRTMGSILADRPYLELVESAGQERMRQRSEGAPAASSRATPSVGPLTVVHRPGGAVVPTAVVVCGSAAVIAAAMGERTLNARVLLEYVRRQVWRGIYNKWHRSVSQALDAVEALQIVVFLDPSRRRGLWVDVDPACQQAAASLLIEIDLSAGLPGRFRFSGR